ncbi:hypothetical protein HDE_10857 [Halotydeus destructor]|nr:hypothetical protein HDE_10857 [Halotydeus destructor]
MRLTHREMLLLVVLIYISSANAQSTRPCYYDAQCYSFEVCDVSPTSDRRLCMATKQLNELCYTDRQCQGQVANSLCRRNTDLELSFCKCEFPFKNLSGKCFAYDYCRYASDCTGGKEYYECKYSRCSVKNRLSDGTYFAITMIVSVAFLVSVTMCCTSRRTERVVTRLPVRSVAALVPPPRTLPGGRAAHLVFASPRLTSSPPLQDELPPPSYSTVVSSGAAYPRAAYDNESFQN